MSDLILNEIQERFGHKEYCVQNKLSYLTSLQSSVLDGYTQVHRHLLPAEQQNRLRMLADRLIEGMTLEFNRLNNENATAVADSEREYYMTQHRLCCSKIPGYAEKMKDKVFEDF
jgi:hypothetical protein